MPLHLTIDLDFWNRQPVNYGWLDELVALKRPMLGFEHHNHLLSWLNQLPRRDIVSIDYHSDVCVNDGPNFSAKPRLNCGTWVNHVKWKGLGNSYTWIFPRKSCFNNTRRGRDPQGRFRAARGLGTCNAWFDRSPFSRCIDTTGWGLNNVKYRLTHYQPGTKLAEMPRNPAFLAAISEISFITSSDYSDWNHVERWKQWLSDNHINYIDGSERQLPSMVDIKQRL
ncbi:MAG: hypothetical protein EBU46_00160 [Nitrosomonadaceae bacterium]|nr:hypothetical protein [Nitrosomonadaceae bacterium]